MLVVELSMPLQAAVIGLKKPSKNMVTLQALHVLMACQQLKLQQARLLQHSKLPMVANLLLNLDESISQN